MHVLRSSLFRPFAGLVATAMMLASTAAHAASHYKIDVPDMSCESCAAALIGTFSKRAEVASVEADIPTHQLLVRLKADDGLGEDTMRELVQASGFTATTIRAQD